MPTELVNVRTVILVPGLGDGAFFCKCVAAYWRLFGLRVQVHCIGWASGDFEPKLLALLRHIDRASEGGHRVALVGISAGASAILNAYMQRKSSVGKIVTVCGFLRNEHAQETPSFKKHARENPPFGESAHLFERTESLLGEADRHKVLTVRARFGDQLVPAASSVLPGATNMQVPSLRHGLTIFLSLTLFCRPIISFIKS